MERTILLILTLLLCINTSLTCRSSVDTEREPTIFSHQVKIKTMCNFSRKNEKIKSDVLFFRENTDLQLHIVISISVVPEIGGLSPKHRAKYA